MKMEPYVYVQWSHWLFGVGGSFTRMGYAVLHIGPLKLAVDWGLSIPLNDPRRKA